MTAPQLTVSIVTPTLNQRQFVGSALGSVAGQTHPAVEHVVIDGGSTDGTQDLLRDAGARIRWVSESDRGMYDALNRGLAMATGDILGYLNSDDAYFPWTAQTVVSAFEARPDVEVLFGDGVRIEDETGVQELRLLPPFDRTALAHKGSLLQPAVFWRRRLIERIGTFDERLRFVGDLDFWLRASETGAIAHVDEVLAVDRIHAEALSQARQAEMAVEERSMRKAHGVELDSPGAQRRLAWAGRREKAWARRLWLRFLRASLRPTPTERWAYFLTEGDVQISRTRLLAGQVPRIGYPLLRGAVRSGLADRLLRGG